MYINFQPPVNNAAPMIR